MRLWLPVAPLAVLVAVLPVGATSQAPPTEYRVEIDRVFLPPRAEGQREIQVRVHFRVRRADGAPVAEPGADVIVIEEDGRKVKELPLRRTKGKEDLTVVLALDISGSMASFGKMEEAKKAALAFLGRLPPKASCGLVLFDHEVRLAVPPASRPEDVARLRQEIADHIAKASPMGGTAYLDATAEAVALLDGVRGDRAVLVMTDGMDVNSRLTLAQAIARANGAEVPVYTIGIGTPGKNEPVTTVLVLDKSLSMAQPADDQDNLSKMDALHRAAGRFIELMRPEAETTLLPFSDKVEKPRPFTSDKADLKHRVLELRPAGQTAILDATFEAVMTLEVSRRPGKRAVVAMTDGRDNRSHRSAKDIIQLARDAKVPLYMLGLGRDKEIDETVMRRLAEEPGTGGEYYRAANQQKLFEVFESLSIRLHDDGIDEASLKQLAEKTGGRYYPAHDVAKLQLIYEQFADELQDDYKETFASVRPQHDGTARGIKIRVVRRGAVVGDDGSTRFVDQDVSGGGDTGRVHVHGVVLPELHAGVYLVLLAALGGLLALPEGLRRLTRPPAEK